MRGASWRWRFRATGRGRGREDGVALVEMAIVVPFLLLIVFGIIEWGVFLSRHIDLNEGVREAGRQGTVAVYNGGIATCSLGTPTDQLVCFAKNRIGVNGVAVHVIGPTTNAIGSTFAVCATYKTTPLTGLLGPFVPTYMHAEAIMRLEQAPVPGLATGGDNDPQNSGWSSCAAPQ